MPQLKNKTLWDCIQMSWESEIPRQRRTLPGGTNVHVANLKPIMEELYPDFCNEIAEMEEVSHFVLRKGEKIGVHRHKDDMEMWVFAWYDEDKHYTDISFCKPGEEHGWENNKGTIVHVFALKWWANSRKAV